MENENNSYSILHQQHAILYVIVDVLIFKLNFKGYKR